MSENPEPLPSVGIANHPFFQGFDPSFVTALDGITHHRIYQAGDFLIREGAPAREFLLILRGKVALEMVTPERPRVTIQTVGSGEVIGWSWLLPRHRWALDARVLKTTEVLEIDGEALRAALEARPTEGYRFLLRLLPVVAERLENTRLQLLDIHGA